MLSDRLLNPGPLTYESGALPIALCSPVKKKKKMVGNAANIDIVGKGVNRQSAGY